jgi:2-dehydro-3-deoxyphosphogluconate aldolase / (4S)-4-hydroxy-2-oxoglutarate aldolase
MSDVTERIRRHGVIPVVVLEDPAAARPLGRALCAGGLPCAEITFRTPAAEAGLAAMAADPELLVGAGTVLTAAQADRAVAVGARFVVTPGFDPAVVRRCRALGVPVYPGVATASEVMAAMRAGVDVVKLFPAEAIGGVRMVAALAAPFPDVRFIPTGGIGAGDVGGYLRRRGVLAVGGSWLVARELVAAGAFGRVRELAADAVVRVAAARAGAAA